MGQKIHLDDTAAATEQPQQRRRKSDARENILRASERLFAEHGFTGCSLRNVADTAGVNQGMIHYFFRSKEALFQETYLRCGTPMVAERMRLLDAEEAAAKGGAIQLERLVEIFLTPAFRLAMSGESGRAFLRMQAHLQLDGTQFGNELRQRLYDDSSSRFVAAFRRSLPDVSREDVSWRFIFMLGAYQYALADTGRIEVVSDSLCSGKNFAESLRQIVPFLAAAMRAPRLSVGSLVMPVTGEDLAR
ncbi:MULTISPECIES: TetR/AcrR family transcriptional regulator [Burkholderiales]|uniref:HTH tetR-type domain-containing protein n=2 Tax=Burkholderiales TaxID=80840 RepID=Q6QHM8_ACHDE|nr:MULTISPECIES: TetR/AcrR family transcriptional regulator [Burkholderiales]AAK81662.1 putative transcription factor [Burkholderia cepacia]AAS49456.1 unknown [Achromobacter denitrificans]